MSDLVKTLLSLSLSGGALALLLLAGGRWFSARFSKRWNYYIWLLVALRLLVPLAPELNLMDRLFRPAGGAVETAAPSTPQDAREPVSPDADARGADREAAAAADAAAPITGSPAASADRPIDWRGLAAAAAGRLGTVWAVAALVLLVRKVTLYGSFSRYLQAGRREVSDPAVLDLLAEAAEQAGVSRPVELYTHPMLSSPVLMGVLRPCVVLPDTDRPAGALRCIFLHELIHCRRGDLLYKWLVQLCVCVHWFNPLVYLMARRVGRACELACDEAVVAALGEEHRRRYGDTLVGALEAGGRYRESVAAVTLHENAAQLKERLEEIMNYTKKTPRVVVAALLVAVGVFASGVFLGAYAARPAAVAELAGPAPVALATGAQADSRLDSKQRTSSSSSGSGSGVTVRTPDPDPAGAVLPNLQGGDLRFPTEGITGVALYPGVGQLVVRPGDGYRIQVGERLRDRATIAVKDGVLVYSDNYPRPLSISLDSWDGYEIVVTLPRETPLEQFVLLGDVCTWDIESVQANRMEVTGMNGRLAGISAGSLNVVSEAGSLQVSDCVATGDMRIVNEAGTTALEGLRANALHVTSEAGGLGLDGAWAAEKITVINEAGSTRLSGLRATSLSILSEAGGIELDGATLTGDLDVTSEAGSMTLKGIQAAGGVIFNEVGSLDLNGSTFTGDLLLRCEVGSVRAAVRVGGDVSIENLDVGSFDLTLQGAKRGDYTVVAQNPNASTGRYSGPAFELDGTEYEYSKTLSGGAKSISIYSVREFGTDVKIRFAG